MQNQYSVTVKFRHSPAMTTRSSVLVAQRAKQKANAKPVLCDSKVQAFTSDDNPLVSFGGVAYKTEGECKTSIL